MEKWSEPKGPPPRWLDLADEVTADEPKPPRDQFVVACMEACLRLDCNPMQAAGVTANVMNESAWGQSYRGNNLGGWKIYEHYAIAYRKAHGKGPRWWRGPGNKAPGATPKDLKGGDPPWCFYRAFESIEDFLASWLKTFVPEPPLGTPSRESKGDPATGDYRLAGERFWGRRANWFDAMVAAGYKGSRTEASPEQAIAEHHSLVQSALTRWGQSRLGVTADGAWGPKSKTACAAFQAWHGLSVTNILDDETLVALVHSKQQPQPE